MIRSKTRVFPNRFKMYPYVSSAWDNSRYVPMKMITWTWASRRPYPAMGVAELGNRRRKQQLANRQSPRLQIPLLIPNGRRTGKPFIRVADESSAQR